MVETLAYYLALIALVTVPATLVAWLLLHPFAAWWRRMGPVATYSVISAVVIAVMWAMYLVREPLLKVRFGVRMPLAAASVVLLAISTYINVQVYRHASKPMVFGLAEISKGNPGELVTGGIYSRMRHPRFVAMALAIVAIAILTNVFAVYVLAVVYVPVICLIALLEERELAARFGARYDEYTRAVPRFLPHPAKHGIRRKGAT